MSNYALWLPVDLAEPVSFIDIDPEANFLEQIRKRFHPENMELASASIATEMIGRGENFIVAVDEYGALVASPVVNWRAWAAYGRSPLFGDAALFLDIDEQGNPSPLPDLIEYDLRALDAVFADANWARVRSAALSYDALLMVDVDRLQLFLTNHETIWSFG